MKIFHYAAVYWNHSWRKNVKLHVNDDGIIQSFKEDCPGGTNYLIPGFNRCHSHSFQYVFSGLTEYVPKGGLNDNFGLGATVCMR